MKKTTLLRLATAVQVVAVFPVFVSCTSPVNRTDPPNTVHWAIPSKIKGLDPIYANDLSGGIEVARAYEGLLQYHYLKRPYVLIPALAEAMPELSKDNLTYTFKIRKGVLFQDDPCFKATGGKGRELVAEDFVYSFKRLADPKLSASGWWILDGKIAGLNEWRAASEKAGATDYMKPVEGLKALDRYTLQVSLTRRSAQLLYNLAMPFAFVVAREAVETYGKEFLNHPVGTGPYRLAEYNPSSKLVWVRNPTFRPETYPSEGEAGDAEAGLLADAGKPLPLNDKFIVQISEEFQPVWLSFLSGKLEISTVPKDSFSDAITPNKELNPELKSKGIRLTKYTLLDVTWMTFNMSDPILGKNKFLRQALSLAYDESAFIELFYNGRAIPAQGPIPPGISGYDPALRNPLRQFNLAKAKELMAKAGYPNGKGLPVLEYATQTGSTYRQIAEFDQKMFEPLGVKLNVSIHSWPEFQATIKSRKAQLFNFAWNADYPDAENFLQLFYSKNGSPGSNDSNFSNPEFDRLYEKAQGLQDGAERIALYRQMEQIVIEEAPWIFGAHRQGYSLVQGWVKNYKYSDVDHGRFKYLRIDPSLKK